MQIFVDIIDSYGAVTAAIDDYDKLSKFMGLILHFNKGKPINIHLKT